MATPTAADLLQPNGPVDPAFYPDDALPPATGDGSVLGRMTTYINRAVAKVAAYPAGSVADVDAAVRLWALHLAFEGAYMVRASRPLMENSQVPVLGSHGYGNQQLVELRNVAAQYRAEFEAMVVGVDSTVDNVASFSSPTKTVIRW